MARTHLFAALIVGASACGGSDAPIGSSQSIRFEIFKGGQNVDCASVPEITRVDGLLLRSNGTQQASGEADCATGTFELNEVPDGSYTVVLNAKGELGADAAGILFSARSDVTLPGDGTAISLRPEVAYLDLEWNFGDLELAPCADQVAFVAVTVGTGNTTTESFTAEYDCTATPIAVPTPFELTEHFIKVEAYNHSGFIDFSTEARRVFDRGDNAYTAMLQPIGGTLLLDWRFAAGPDIAQACDAAFVQVDDLVATVRALDGNEVTSEVVDCTAARPYVYRGRRYAPGRELELSLEADGAHRFIATMPFTMPQGDYAPGALTLEAVGTATITVEVATSTCTSADTQRFDVTVFEVPPRSGEVMVFEGEIPAAETMVSLPLLTYGEYRVEVVQQGSAGPICTLDEPRTIDEKENTWAPFVF